MTNPLNTSPITATTNEQQWIVQLAGDPAVRVYRDTRDATGSTLAAMQAARQQRERLSAEQAAFMEALAAAGIQARLISQTQFLVNMITIAVDDYPGGNLMARLRGLPNVVAVFPDSVVTADDNTRAPNSDNPIMPSAPDEVRGDSNQ